MNMHALKLMFSRSTFGFYGSTRSLWAGTYCISVAHGDVATFARSSKAGSLPGHLLRTANRCSTGFIPDSGRAVPKHRSHSRRSRWLADRHVCFGALSWRRRSSSLSAFSQRFCANADWYLELSIVPRTLPELPFGILSQIQPCFYQTRTRFPTCFCSRLATVPRHFAINILIIRV